MAAIDVDELFARTLEGDYEDDAPWQAVHDLRRIGTRQVFDKAAKWAESAAPLMRARGIDVLAQLGRTAKHPTNSFPEESYAIVTKALQQERESTPLNSAISALGHLDDARAIPLLAAFRSHPNAEIRFSVACALGSFPNDALSIEALLALMEDADEQVRDWATFGLGVLGDEDSAVIRDSLYQWLNDSNADVHEEALVGLAKRHDPRSLPTLIDALERPNISNRVVEAAYTLLGMDDDCKDWSGLDYANALRQRFPAESTISGQYSHELKTGVFQFTTTKFYGRYLRSSGSVLGSPACINDPASPVHSSVRT
jgi:HEAT repeat protein